MHDKSRLITLYGWLLLIIFGGIVVTAPVTVFFGSHFPRYDLLIKSWKEILMGVAFIIATVEVTRRAMWREILSDWVMRLIAAFGVLHILLLAWHWRGAKAAGAGLLIDLRYLLFFALVYVLVTLAPWYRLRLLITAACGAIVVVVFGFLQLFLPRDLLAHIGYGPHTIQPYLTVDRNPNYVRINSTLRGPNPVGAYAGMVLTMMLAIVARQTHRFKNTSRIIGFIIIAICALVSLWLSYSRSAVIGAVVALALVVGIRWGKILRTKWKELIEIGIVVIFLGIFISSQGGFLANVIRHDNPGTGAKITSDAAHLSSLKNGFAQFVRQPLGDGIGSTGSASLLSDNGQIIENQYLFVAHESGWIGLGLYLAIIVMILRRTWRDRRDWLALGVGASGVGLLIIGILLPVFADDTVSIVWWGLAAIAYAGVTKAATIKGNGRQSSHKKTA